MPYCACGPEGWHWRVSNELESGQEDVGATVQEDRPINVQALLGEGDASNSVNLGKVHLRPFDELHGRRRRKGWLSKRAIAEKRSMRVDASVTSYWAHPTYG